MQLKGDESSEGRDMAQVKQNSLELEQELDSLKSFQKSFNVGV